MPKPKSTPARGAATGNTTPTLADGEAILNKWHRSIAEIWAPTAHATGFVIDARGLIATYDRAIGDATDVEVEFGGPAAGATDRVKVAGRVLASDRTQGVTIIWIHPEAIASRPPIAPTCPSGAEALAKAAGQPLVTHDQKVVALIAPMLEPKSALLGSASRPDAQSFRTDWHLDPGSAGGPVFAADGTAIGITVGEVEEDRRRREDDYVIPLSNACRVIEAAAQKMSGATPPSATLLRTEVGLPRTKVSLLTDKKTPRVQPPVITADEFDISLVSPAMIGGDQTTSSSRTFFGYWTPYVSNAPQVMLLRVSPQFEESFWKMLARGAAQTQGVALPPLRSFSANFLRLRAFCGGTEVEPIHRFIIEMPIEGRKPVREGLYVFALTDFGPHCTSVRVELFSEKSPNRPDSRTIDPKLFTLIAGHRRHRLNADYINRCLIASIVADDKMEHLCPCDAWPSFRSRWSRPFPGRRCRGRRSRSHRTRAPRRWRPRAPPPCARRPAARRSTAASARIRETFATS